MATGKNVTGISSVVILVSINRIFNLKGGLQSVHVFEIGEQIFIFYAVFRRCLERLESVLS
jgi:hypothetical protein